MKQFPIMLGLSYELPKLVDACRALGVRQLIVSVPWAMLAPHEPRAKANHGQTLQRLAERGGLGASEAMAVLQDRPYARYRDGEAIAHSELAKAVAAWMVDHGDEA